MHCTVRVHGHLQVDMYMYIHVYNVHVQCTFNSSPITALQKAPCGQWTALHRVASGPHSTVWPVDCTPPCGPWTALHRVAGGPHSTVWPVDRTPPCGQWTTLHCAAGGPHSTAWPVDLTMWLWTAHVIHFTCRAQKIQDLPMQE